VSIFSGELLGVVNLIKGKVVLDRDRVNEESTQLTKDQLQERKNAEYAEKIASFVQRNGEKRFGEMWSELHGNLPYGNKVFLQVSDKTMEIDITPNEDNTPEIYPYKIHVCFDRGNKNIRTYEERQIYRCSPDRKGSQCNLDKPIVYYQVNIKECIPPDLSPSKVLHDVGEILTQVERSIVTPNL
jgi:hypothetical protein